MFFAKHKNILSSDGVFYLLTALSVNKIVTNKLCQR
ncbi:hypothetical protein JCM5805K_2805 [Lactococcus lactis subsp. lactis]|uniref:Uncharacterized protein n=1 Tax=Lactococcus lactis subsp. lactis TaxID=1360 RepID=A0A0B8QSM2_LACLL|nr:hypothetical protein JCM5805K_2805 [Lactococcus lactis subsp. lactis]